VGLQGRANVIEIVEVHLQNVYKHLLRGLVTLLTNVRGDVVEEQLQNHIQRQAMLNAECVDKGVADRFN